MWTLLLALCLVCVSSDGQRFNVDPFQMEDCEPQSLRAQLGSSVLLPCLFSTNGLDRVTWAHVHELDLDLDMDQDLVDLLAEGRVKFLDPRHGRVKTFPNQVSVGNFSIRIDELRESDLGFYLCKMENKCVSVKLHADKGEQFYEEPYEKDSCETRSLVAPLGSSVLLPCIFLTNSLNWVTWVHDRTVLVDLASNGRVKFLDPRHGRLKAFVNQASVGNFSVCIDELKDSDLGSYICEQENKCFKVDLLDISTLHANVWLLIYICVGVAALILLCVFGYFCYESLHNKRSQDIATNTAGPSAPPQEQGHEHHIGANNNSVYENDDQYIVTSDPTRNQSAPAGNLQHPSGAQPNQSNTGIYPNLEAFKFERVESQRTRRFHIELISRLRQASLSRHFYANQQEINKQQAMAARSENQRARKAKNTVPASDGDYQNPIYNRSTDQLNRL